MWQYGGPAPANAGREVVFGRSISTVAIHDGLLYAVELDGFLHCLDAKTGAKYWEYDLKDQTWNSPFYVDGKSVRRHQQRRPVMSSPTAKSSQSRRRSTWENHLKCRLWRSTAFCM